MSLRQVAYSQAVRSVDVNDLSMYSCGPAVRYLSRRFILSALAKPTRTRGQTVISQTNLERYGAKVRIDGSALAAAGGPAIKTSAETLGLALLDLRAALSVLTETISSADENTSGASEQLTRRKHRVTRLTRSLLRDLRTLIEHHQWFWQFKSSANYVRVIELGRRESSRGNNANAARGTARSSISISAVPINVGPLLWEQLWSRLHAVVCTSATLTVYGQGFDFFLNRIGLESERVASSAKQLITRELPHAFDYHKQALLMLPNNLPAPRDSELKRNFPAAVAELLGRFIPFFEGKMLGLFTSKERRDFVYRQLAEQGFPLLSQGQGSLRRLIDDFRADKASSLLGSR
jgi:ATP-dependent DNA helicase RecQ